jgi:hypothetical protein
MEKLTARFPRTLANLRTAICDLPYVLIFDNDDLRSPYRRVAVVENGRAASLNAPLPRWLKPLLRELRVPRFGPVGSRTIL